MSPHQRPEAKARPKPAQAKGPPPMVIGGVPSVRSIPPPPRGPPPEQVFPRPAIFRMPKPTVVPKTKAGSFQQSDHDLRAEKIAVMRDSLPPEPPAKANPPEPEPEALAVAIKAMYSFYDPKKLSGLELVLNKYCTVDQRTALLKTLKQKYCGDSDDELIEDFLSKFIATAEVQMENSGTGDGTRSGATASSASGGTGRGTASFATGRGGATASSSGGGSGRGTASSATGRGTGIIPPIPRPPARPPPQKHYMAYAARPQI